MAVYVDWLANHGWVLRGRRVPSCHLLADTLEELHAFAARIGLKREWFQGNASAPHYDLTADRRAAAVTAGAAELTRATFRDAYQKARASRVRAQ